MNPHPAISSVCKMLKLLSCGMCLVLGLWTGSALGSGASAETAFQSGIEAYRAGDFTAAAKAFTESAAQRPTSGAFQNLGNAEWQRGRPGYAIVAWERALWVNPRNVEAQNDLRFARKTAQLESPTMALYEVVSSWLPASWWAWLAGTSLWVAIGAVMLPVWLRTRRTTWHQGVAAMGLTIFLLSVPAHFGIMSRARQAFVLQKDTALRLTPTAEAQAITRLSAGEPARFIKARGNYVMVRTSRGIGWLNRDDLGWINPA